MYKREDGGLGGRRWECIAITLPDYQDFLQSIVKSRHPDERLLHKRITDDILPIIEQAEAYALRKKQKQEREMLNIQKLASAKRSTRIEAKLEKERHEREAYEAAQRRKSEVAEAEAYQRTQEKMDMDRESRMMTREQRLKEREMKRILHEQELARMSEEEKKADAGESRVSERQLRAEMEKTKKVLAALQHEDEWTFDCSKCGQHGANLVCAYQSDPSNCVDAPRMMVHTAWLVRGAMSGSIVLAWAFPCRRLRGTTFTSFAMIANAVKKTQRSPRYPVSNSESGHQARLHSKRPNLG